MAVEQLIKPGEGINFEATVERLKRERFMYPHFIDGIIGGAFHRLPIDEIIKIVREHHLNPKDPSLTNLSKEEESLLEATVVDDLDSSLNRDCLELLCGPTYIDEVADYYFINLYVKGALPHNSEKLRLLSREEKIRLFFDPIAWRKIQLYQPGGSSGVREYGNRNLLGSDGYFSSANEFKDLVKEIRERSKVENLAVLDIGCGMGKALQDMKDIDPRIETHGITMEQEPAMYNADFFHYLAAERMPASFKDRFHLITSNIAFRYFLFQNLALRSVVRALAQGGHAQIAFAYDRMPETSQAREYFAKKVPESKSNYEAMKTIVSKEIDKLNGLESKGFIKFTISPYFYDHSTQGAIRIDKIRNFDNSELDD